MAACCQGGVCFLPSSSDSSASPFGNQSENSARLGPRIGIPFGKEINPDELTYLNSHADSILNCDASLDPSSATLRLQSINGHNAARFSHAFNPQHLYNAISGAPSNKKASDTYSLQFLYGYDRDATDLAPKSSLTSLIDGDSLLKSSLLKRYVSNSLGLPVLRHKNAAIGRILFDTQGVIDATAEYRLSPWLSVKGYAIQGRNSKTRFQQVGGINLRFDSDKNCTVVKGNSDGMTVGISTMHALGTKGTTSIGAEAYWINAKKDYTAAVGIRHRWYSPAYTRPFVLSADFQNYGFTSASFSAPIGQNTLIAAKLSHDIPSRRSDLAVATQWTPSSDFLSSIGLSGSTTLHGKLDVEKGAMAGIRYHHTINQNVMINATLSINQSFGKRAAFSNPMQLSIQAQII